MRIVFDVTNEVQVCGGGQPYRNMIGFQGMDDIQTGLTLIFESSVENQPADVVEIEGRGKYIIRMLHSALDALEGMRDVAMKQNGPKRPTPCPDCDPQTIYPNATHTEECAHSKYWKSAREGK